MAGYVSKVGTKKRAGFVSGTGRAGAARGAPKRVSGAVVKAGARKPNIPTAGTRGSKMGTGAAQRRGAAAVSNAAAQRKYNANFKPRGTAPAPRQSSAGPKFSSSNTAGGILVDAINAPREIGEFLKNLGR